MKTVLKLVMIFLAVTLSAGNVYASHWEHQKKECKGSTLKVSARLMDIPWGHS